MQRGLFSNNSPLFSPAEVIVKSQEYISIATEKYIGDGSYENRSGVGKMLIGAVHDSGNLYDLHYDGTLKAVQKGSKYRMTLGGSQDGRFYVYKNGAAIKWEGLLTITDIDANETVYVQNSCIKKVLYMGDNVNDGGTTGEGNRKFGNKSGTSTGASEYLTHGVYLLVEIPTTGMRVMHRGDSGASAASADICLADVTTKGYMQTMDAKWTDS